MKKKSFTITVFCIITISGFIVLYSQTNPANPWGEIFLKKDKISQKQYEYLHEVLDNETNPDVIKNVIDYQIKAFEKGIEDPVDHLGNIIPFIDFKTKRNEEIKYYNSLKEQKVHVEWPSSKREEGYKIDGYVTNLAYDEKTSTVIVYITRFPDKEIFRIFNQLWAPIEQHNKKENELRLSENAKFIILPSIGYVNEKKITDGKKSKLRKQKALAAAAAEEERGRIESAQEKRIFYSNKDFIVQGVKYDNNYVTGKLINRTNITYSLVIITFSLYNDANEQVGTATDTLKGLDANGIWRFKAYDFGVRATSCKFHDISTLK